MTSSENPRRSEGLTPVSPNGQAPRSRTSGRDDHVTWGLISLAMLDHMLRSRRFYAGVASAAVGLAALSSLGQESRTQAFGRLAAWNKRQVQLLERKVEREAGRLERKAEREAKRLAGKAKAS